MLSMAKTAQLQADPNIGCREIAEIDAAIKPWVLLVLDEGAPASECAWRLVGAFVAETEALAAHRRLSQIISDRGLAMIASLFRTAPILERRTTSGSRRSTFHPQLPGVAIARSTTGARMAAGKMAGS